MIAVGRNAAHQRVPVVAVRRDDVVVGGQRVEHTDRDRLLADVEVHEPADARRAVELDAALLEPPDAHHLAQQARARRRDRAASVMTRVSSIERSPSGSPSSARAQEPAHDLAAARLREVGAEVDLLGRDRGAEPLAAEADQLEAQRVARLVARVQHDERLDDRADDRDRACR